MAKRVVQPAMRVVPRFVYDPEKAERGLKAMADILASALRCANGHQVTPERLPLHD